VKRVYHLAGLEHGELQQLVGWGGRHCGVLVGGEGAEPVTGLRRDDHTGTAASDHVSELLEHERGCDRDGGG
jgi:hypothetical protein